MKYNNNVIFPYKVLKDAAFMHLKRAILEGKYGFGQKISEQEVANELEISRGPVREALITLEREGLVENIPQKGSYVIELKAKDIEEIYSLRACLERMAVGRITNNLASVDIEILRKLIQEMGKLAEQKDVQELIECELNFHEAICFLADHVRLLKTWQQMRGPIRMLLAASDVYTPHEEGSQVQHQQVLDAILEGDQRKAEETIEEHIMSLGRRLINHFRALEEGGAEAGKGNSSNDTDGE